MSTGILATAVDRWNKYKTERETIKSFPAGACLGKEFNERIYSNYLKEVFRRQNSQTYNKNLELDGYFALPKEIVFSYEKQTLGKTEHFGTLTLSPTPDGNALNLQYDKQQKDEEGVLHRRHENFIRYTTTLRNTSDFDTPHMEFHSEEVRKALHELRDTSPALYYTFRTMLPSP